MTPPLSSRESKAELFFDDRVRNIVYRRGQTRPRRTSVAEDHRCLWPLVDRKRENVRPRVVPDNIEIELASCNFVQVQLGRKHKFPVSGWPGEDLSQGRHDDASAPDQYRAGIVALD